MTTPLEEVKAGVLAWLESVSCGNLSEGADYRPGRYRYNLHMVRPWAVESSCLAAMIYFGLGAMDRLDKPAVIADIQSWQDPATGLFHDPLIQKSDRASDHHTWEHIWLHHTGVCMEALSCLGAAPLHPMRHAAFAPLRPGEVRETVLAMDWTNPWMVGEHWFRMVEAYCTTQGIDPTRRDDPALNEAFEVIEREVLNDRTGLPDRWCDRPQVSMAGLFKIMFGYLLCHRPVPFARKAIDSVLAMQTPEGGFGMDNMCIHFDAALVLCVLNRQLCMAGAGANGAHRFGDIAAAGSRLSRYLMKEYRKSDGAFSFEPGHCIAIHDSIRISEPLPESDMIGTLMCMDCLRFAEAWRNGVFQIESPIELRFHRFGNSTTSNS